MTESFCLRSPRLQRHLASAAYFVCCFAILSPDVLAQFRLREPSTQSSDNEAPTTATPRLTAPIVRKPSAMNIVNRDLESEVRHDTEGEGKVADDSEPREESDLPDEETVLPSVRTMRFPPSMERSLKRPSSDAGSGTSRPMESEPVELIDADPEPSDFAAGPVPRTRGILEEAALRDAGLVGQFACAAGDRGVICTSRDGGLSWTTSALELDCQLMSVCFLTDQVGWIGGWIRDSQSSDRQSLIVATRDGGVSWTRLIGPPVLPGSSTLTASNLPPIIHLEYFGLDEAVVVTMSSERHGSKRIFQSRDGGLTWSAINADEASEEWLGADFISPSEGIIGGERECYATVVANQAVVINSPQPTLRGMRGASLDSSGSGWLVGDGGNLVVTDNAGVTWRTPDGRRPEEFSRLADLRTVTHHDKIVIAAGSPGSFVLRSEDAGNTWDVIPTTARGLLHRIRLNSQGLAIAVGTFGQILRSTDSGFTWETVRSEQRRTGLLNLAGNSLDISWNLMARVAAEDGIRSAVVQMSQPFDAGISSISQRWHPRAAERLAALGICDGASDWMFARTRPEAHRSAMMLVSEWDRQTDGQLRELLPLRLARQLRIWQPSVVVVEPCPMQGSGDDAVASILRDALPRAIQMAADEHHPGLGRLHLPAWTVARVVTRTQRDGTSSLKYSETDLLPRLRTTTGLLVDFAKGAEAVDRSSRLLSSSDSFYTIAFD
ncbi:MAG: WD40/YVTN/BNR-like repeat-containing protein, partial [Planctomycetota bacterium]